MSAAAARQRLDLAAVKVQSARDTLTCFRGAASAAQELVTGFAHVPPAVMLRILSFLPVDARARATLVCCAWRDSLADPAVWTVLDLSPESGVRRPVTEDVLRGAAARARGQLVALNADGCEELTTDAVLEVVTSNRCLLKLSTACTQYSGFPFRPVDWRRAAFEFDRQLAAAAPQLLSFKTHVDAPSLADAMCVLRGEAPFGALQPLELGISYDARSERGDAAVLAFCSAVASTQRPPQSLFLEKFPLETPGALDTLFVASIARQLRGLVLIECHLTPASLPALASVIHSGVLESLSIDNNNLQLFNESTCEALADAIATNRTLKTLILHKVRLWHDARCSTAIIHALTGHPTLEHLSISSSEAPAGQDAAGAALGRLVAANTPALTDLDLDRSRLRDEGLRPLFEALPHNTHLRTLDVRFNLVSVGFARDTVLPAVEANTSLRELRAYESNETPYGVRLGDFKELGEAVKLVMARNEEV